MAERVLVTGGTGFVAGWCIATLLGRGSEVCTTVRSATSEGEARAAVQRAMNVDDARLSVAIADLTSDEGWGDAMHGCGAVLHVASPLGGSGDADLTRPAVEGTVRVLTAAARAGVRRVVMTSAAATARPPLGDKRVSDETIWADASDPQFDGYRRSKILAERAAWAFAAGHPGLELTTILPGAVFGPVLTRARTGSSGIIGRLLEGFPAALPRLGFWVTDVRDLAEMHIRALQTSAAAGERFLVAGEFRWMEEIAATLREQLGEAAANVPEKLLEPGADLGRELRGLAPMLGRVNPLTTAKAKRILGLSPRAAEDTVIDCARSLLADAG